MNEREYVLFANDTFYNAFASGDCDAMDQLWSMSDPTCCIHPGWPPLTDRAAIMQSWRSILTADGTKGIRATMVDVQVLGEFGVVVCRETLGQAVLFATNIYRHEASRWRMIHHHASATRMAAGHDDPAPPPHN